VLVFAYLIHALATARYRAAGRVAALFAVGLVLVYGMMLVDNRLGFWHAAGLDYSTHTAVALMLTVVLVVALRRWWVLWSALALAYLALCVYQRYHSIADVVTTAVYLLPLHCLASRAILGNWRFRAGT
jgi:hypothetical protein